MVYYSLLNYLSLLILYILDDDFVEIPTDVWVYWGSVSVVLIFVMLIPGIYYQRLRGKRIQGPIKQWNEKYAEQNLVAVVNSKLAKMMSVCNCDKRSYKWFPEMAVQIHALHHNKNRSSVLEQYDVYM